MLDGETSREGSALAVSAPCGGTIVKLVVKNVGTVVRSSDVLAEITCRDDRLRAELMVPQRGLALLRAGQLVKLRYDAFPFQRFGVRHATLRWISPSASLPSPGGSVRAIADLDEADAAHQRRGACGAARHGWPGGHRGGTANTGKLCDRAAADDP